MSITVNAPQRAGYVPMIAKVRVQAPVQANDSKPTLRLDAREAAVWQRVRIFGFAFSGNFERGVREEIAQRDLTIESRRPGVLTAQGLFKPTVLAVWRAARLALGGECDRVQSAEALFRAARGHRTNRAAAKQNARTAKQEIPA